MKKFLWLLPFIAAVSWGAQADCFVGAGTPENAFVEGDIYGTGDAEIDGVLLLEAATAAVDDVTPTVAGGNILITGINTVPTAITDLDLPIPGATYTIICGDIANASTIADAGNFTLNGAWNPATVSDSITLYCFADNDYREVSRSYAVAGPVEGDPFLAGPDVVGAPGHSWIADPTTGVYNIGAGDVGVAAAGALVGNFDATGLNTCVIGATVPADGTFLDVIVDEDFQLGQDPPDIHIGYKDRSDYITFSETFDIGVDADLAVRWDIATLVVGGPGSFVDETTNDGWCLLTTGGAGGPDSAGIRSAGLNHDPAYATRIETVVDLGAIAAGQTFHFGFWAAAARYVEIIHEPDADANWVLRVDDTAGAETENSGVPATLNPTKLEIAVTAGGVVSWAIDDVAMPVGGITNVMANPHYVRWYLLDVAGAGHTATIDYYISEQLKQQ